MSSGRWRSRHWRSEDGSQQQHPSGRGAEQQRYDGNRNYHHGRQQSSWNDGPRGNYNEQQYQHHNYDQLYRRDGMAHSDIMSRGNYNYNESSDYQRGTNNMRWQRGQHVPQRQHDHPRQQRQQQQQHRARSANDDHPNNSTNRVIPSKPPTNAWGKSSSSVKTEEVASSSVDGAVKLDNSTKESSQSTTNNNAWKKPNPPSSDNNSSVKVDFPSLSSQKELKSSSVNDQGKIKGEPDKDSVTNHNIASSSSLPTNSSWGKSHSSLGWAAKQSQPPSGVQQKKKQVGEEFPSLSASMGAPRKQQSQETTTRAAAVHIEEMTKKSGSNKKSAAPTNLASYLPPQIGDTSEKKKGAANTKKQQASTAANKSGHKVANTVPSSASTSVNHGNNKKKHSREESRAPLLHHQHYRAVASTANNNSTSATTTTGAPPIKKGRQRLAPRKKKLTTLKKRVLEERLRVWKERNGGESSATRETSGEQSADDGVDKTSDSRQDNAQTEKSTTLLVYNFVNPEEDDLNDDDEHDELVSNLINLAGRVGRVVSVYIPRPLCNNDNSDESALEESKHVGLSFVRLATCQDALAARDILDCMMVGGQKLCTKVLYSVELEACDAEFSQSSNLSSSAVPSEESEQQWRRALHRAIIADQSPLSLKRNASIHEDVDGNVSLLPLPECSIVFHNILSEDDYEDEDALEESIEDIKSIAGQLGHVVNARGDDSGNVYVTYDSSDIATFAAITLDGMLLGGVKISVSVDGVDTINRTVQAGMSAVVLDNVFTEDDFEDEDCLNESMQDIRTLAEKYGVVGNVTADTSNEEERGKVKVEYTGGLVVAVEAAKQLNGMLFGGRIISATLLSSGLTDTGTDGYAPKQLNGETKIEKEEPQPMFSGDKVIPERFAQCKRVPKVANSGTPRAYATKIPDDRAIPLLTEILGELMRLQQRAKDQANARSRRRLVMGLREVARGIRAHKVKMVVMANNLDEYGAIDSKLQEILDLAHAEDVPVIYELNKRKLGKAVGKSIKVAVVGIQNVSGAEQQFKQLKRMAGVT